MEGFSFQQLKDLQQLVAPTKEDSDSDSEEEDLKQRLSRQKISPGDIGIPNATGTPASAETKDSKEKKVNSSDIWHPAEASAITDFQDGDPREVPEYEMKFRQAVGTEDIFLGMNLKTTATASCEWMTVMVKLPSEIREKIELSVESNVVDVRSPRYRLQLPTPFPVDPNGSSAKWHSDSDCLEITLKLSRELDDVNF